MLFLKAVKIKTVQLVAFIVKDCLHVTSSGTTFEYNVRPGRLSPRSEFTPVPSHGSIFVYMIPPQNVMPARVTPA